MKKNFFNWRILALAVTSATFIYGSCNDDDEVVPPAPKTVTQTVVDDPNFSFLEAAVIKAGLANTLASTQNITVFAPDNAAFIKAGFANEAAVTAADATVLKSILENHVLAVRRAAADLPTANNTAVGALGNETIYVTKSASGVFINGSQVTAADINASNGVIHKVNTIILPHGGKNLLQVAQATPALSRLVAAVLYADSASILVTALASAGPLTVLAPKNQAFTDAGLGTSFTAFTPAQLRNILLYHIVGARVFSNLVPNNMPVTMLNTKNVTAFTGTTVQFLGLSNGTNRSTVESADVIASNGVVHVIDRILLP
jgi:uncharacterized surface protein with fasciclin (FAS1) repeats